TCNSCAFWEVVSRVGGMPDKAHRLHPSADTYLGGGKTMVAATIENRIQKAAEETQVSERGATNLQKINVGEAERWASLAGGAALGVYGLTRGKLGGLALAVAGGALMYRGLSGQWPLYCGLGGSSA